MNPRRWRIRTPARRRHEEILARLDALAKPPGSPAPSAVDKVRAANAAEEIRHAAEQAQREESS